MNDIQRVTALVFDLEKANYIMRKTIDGIQRELNALPSPVKPVYKEPKLHEHYGEHLYDGVVFGFAGLISSPIVTILLCIFGKTDHSFFRTLIVLAPILCILGVVLGVLIAELNDNKNRMCTDNYNRRVLKEAKDEYHKARVDYQKLCNEIIPKREKLMEQQKQVKSLLYTSESMLQSLYNTHGIISDFRNLVCAGYMYKLAEMGASTSFTGEHGLFYLTYKELRADRLEAVIGTVGDRIVSSIHGTICSSSHYLSNDINLCDYRSRNLVEGTAYTVEDLEKYIEERKVKMRYLT